MRGVAALIIVFYHLALPIPIVVPRSGYLAVDFFFVLSGLVVSKAYRATIIDSGAWRFLKIRIIRFYPIYLLGFALGLTRILGQYLFADAEAPSTAGLLAVVLGNGLMLPAPIGYNELFPAVQPAWSLFLELAVNLAFAVLLVRLGVFSLAALLVVAGLILVIGALDKGSLDLGWNWPTLGYGVARVLFSFIAGLLIDHVISRRNARASLWGCAPPVILGALLFTSPPDSLRPIFDLLFVLIGSPLLVCWAAVWDIPAGFRRLSSWAGSISYPLYTLHYPAMMLVVFVGWKLGIPSPVIWIGFLTGLVLTATLSVRWYDAPVRNWLTQRFVATPATSRSDL